MSKAILGNRVAKSAIPRPIVTAVILEDPTNNVLLTKRTDNGRWCLPGGAIDPGESAEEACVREVKEETGLSVRISRLIGIYTSPDLMIEYDDGNKIQPIVMSFKATVIGGILTASNETTAFGYFSNDQITYMDILEFGREEIQDAISDRKEAFIR